MAKRTVNPIDFPDTIRNSGFIGRRTVLTNVGDTLEHDETAVVLKGPGGVGKTAVLVRAIALLKKKSFESLVFRGAVSAETLLKTLADHAVEKGIENAAAIFESLTEYKEKLEKVLEHFVYQQQLLLVFEDFDENQDTGGALINERLQELLTYLQGVLKDKRSRMLFTSQYDILKFPSIAVEPFTWTEFKEMIAQTLTLKRLDKKSLKSLYFEMGGYPRTVDLLDRIAEREFGSSAFTWTLLKAAIPNLSERLLYKDNEAADFSYLLVEKLLGYLDPARRRILEALSIYKGEITPGMIRAQGIEISPAQRKKLEELNLIFYSAKTQRYFISPLIRHIVQSRMGEAERRNAHLSAARYFQALDRLDPQARRHYLEAEDWGNAFLMTVEMDVYYSRIGFPQLAFDLLKDLEKHVGEIEEANQIHYHNRMAMFYSVFGKLDEAISHNEKALTLNRAREDMAGIAVNLGQIGLLYEVKGKDSDALDYFQKALDIAEKQGDIGSTARLLERSGNIHKRMGHYPEAFDCFQRTLAIHRDANDRKAVAYALEQLGRICDEQTQFSEALDYYRQSIAVKEEIDDRPGIAELVHQMGNVYFVQGNLDEAYPLYQRSLSIKEALGDAKGLGYSLGQIGLIYHRQGNVDEALIQYEKSLEQFEKAGEDKGVAASNHQIGRIYETRGDHEKALAHYEKAIEFREKIGDMLGAAVTYGQLGMLYYTRQEFETAMRHSTRAYVLFSKYGSPSVELARRNMLRIKEKLSPETFDAILKEFGIQTSSSHASHDGHSHTHDCHSQPCGCSDA
ncbi:MAG: tetratricopeptide repeat protein [Candidatus Omnitrophota bacterium]